MEFAGLSGLGQKSLNGWPIGSRKMYYSSVDPTSARLPDVPRILIASPSAFYCSDQIEPVEIKTSQLLLASYLSQFFMFNMLILKLVSGGLAVLPRSAVMNGGQKVFYRKPVRYARPVVLDECFLSGHFGGGTNLSRPVSGSSHRSRRLSSVGPPGRFPDPR